MSITPRRRIKLMVGLLVAWFALVLLMGVWWTRLALRQADHIRSLETTLGLSSLEIEAHWQQVHRMIFWESGTYLVLLLAATALLIWMYLREVLRSRSLQAFFASLSHELKAPLTSIRLQAESLEHDLQDTQSQRLVSRLLADTLRLESQVERTLELARVEGGGGYYAQPLHLSSFLENLLQPWRETHRDRLLISNDVGDLWVLADPAALSVVFRNLIENSVKHGGRSMIEARIHVTADDVIVFEDDGEGSLDGKQKWGQLYAKGPQSSGAGVGLYLVKTLMARMKGSAHFCGSKSKGFRVELRLPRSQNEVAHGG